MLPPFFLTCPAVFPPTQSTAHCHLPSTRLPPPPPFPPPARLQDYIENENARLDRESQFWSKEIVVRIEYKFCPNLTIIDTPGARLGAWVMGAGTKGEHSWCCPGK